MKDNKMYSGYRYPSHMISHTVWLYFRFTLSFRDVEELLAARGIVVSYETIRQWCQPLDHQCTGIEHRFFNLFPKEQYFTTAKRMDVMDPFKQN